MVSSESLQSSQEQQESMSVTEKLDRILSWTIPIVEVNALVQPQGSEAVPLDKESWMPIIAQVARIRSDSQNAEGIKLGYYQEGLIVDSKYTYAPPPGKKGRKPKYKPNVFPGSEKVMRELFPQTSGIERFARQVIDQTDGRIGYIEVQSSIDWARLGYYLFTSGKFKGNRWIERHEGIPILVFKDHEDLSNLDTFDNYKIPENTQAISFVTPEGKLGKGTPLVAKHESASLPDIDQHIRTLLMFAQVVDPSKTTPILVSQFTPTPEDYLRLKIKERVLSLLIREKEAVPADWHRTDTISQSIEAALSELFLKRLRLTEQSPFYIDEWPDIRKNYGINYQNIVRSWFHDEIFEAFYAVGEVPTVLPAREATLDKVNIFSLFPDWKEASRLQQSWKGRFEHRRSFGIPYKRSSNEHGKPLDIGEVETAARNQEQPTEETEVVEAKPSQIDDEPPTVE